MFLSRRLMISHKIGIIFMKFAMKILLCHLVIITSWKFTFGYTSFVIPDIFYSYDMVNNVITIVSEYTVNNYDRTQYETHRIIVENPKDGALVPVTLVYNIDVYNDEGQALQNSSGREPKPMYLYGYGAYGTLVSPWFDTTRLSLLDRGFIYGIVDVRGSLINGGEWYIYGRNMYKHNSFDDFIACVNYLVEQNYTTNDLLAIEGVSAGGLLVTGVITISPMIAHVVLAGVPFVDVINSMSDPQYAFVVQEYPEWGNPANITEFDNMLSYDPYQQISSDRLYPNMLFTAGLNDARVNYWEPAKFVAKLRAQQQQLRMSSENTSSEEANIPQVLLHTTNAGHSGESGDNYYYDVASYYAFIINKIVPFPENSSSDEGSGSSFPTWAIIVIVVVGAVLIVALLAIIIIGIVLYIRRQRFSYTTLGDD